MQIESYIDIIFWLFFISLFAIFVLFVYWNILHLFLTRKYDKLLFKEPYFNPTEIGVYSVWPFSLVKATAYILLITGSPIAKKRFKTLEEPINETATVKFFCHLWKVLELIFGGIFFVCVIWGGIDMALSD